MSAWTQLLAISALTTGSAWDLLANPAAGGGGGTSSVVSAISFTIDQASVTVQDATPVVYVTQAASVVAADATQNITVAPGGTIQS